MNGFTKLAAVLSVVGIGALSLGADRSQPVPAPSDKPTQTLQKQDAEFFDEASMGGLLEVRLGQLAAKHAASEEVRKYGQRMVDEHMKLTKDLGQVVSGKGLAVPQALDKKHQDIVDKLSKETGTNFDRAYMSRMVDDHDHDVKAFEKQAKDGKDADLRQFATKSLPLLREHLTQAKEIEARLKK